MHHKQSLLLILILTATILFPAIAAPAAEKDFTVVIDAGHGGQDPGALGNIAREKDLNLSVALKLGKRISEEFDDVRVLYTRKTDVFLKLQERANFVNKNNADLFICVHTNSAENHSVAGAETFTLGLDKLQSNLDVAMRENSVMLLEENYKTTYQGFNPNSVESYIMFEFMQDQYIDRSLQFASLVQKQFTGTYNRNDRGVRQAAFWVLHKSACPSVLVEMGFISNRDEERYLVSEKGQNEMAAAICAAFASYKRDIDKKSGKSTAIESTEQSVQNQPEIPDNDSTTENLPIYKVQIFSVKEPLKKDDRTFRGLTGATYFRENGYYKYTYGEETDYEKITAIRQNLLPKFKDAFIIAFLNGKRISLKEALSINK